MKPYSNSTVGVTVPVQVFESADEFDRAAGRVGACVEEANRSVIYRQWNHKFRAALCEALVEETGIARTTKVVKDKDGNEKEVITDKELEYINGRLADGLSEDKLNKIAQEVASGIELDPAPTKRGSKVPKEIEAAAAGIMGHIEEGNTTAEIVASKLGASLGVDFVNSYGEVSEASVIAALVAIKEMEDRQRTDRFI